jgi:hypothetical protein
MLQQETRAVVRCYQESLDKLFGQFVDCFESAGKLSAGERPGGRALSLISR